MLRILKAEPGSASGWYIFANLLMVACPKCGNRASLDHQVHPDGRVEPSMDCPECSFHEIVILDGWDLGFRDFRKGERG